MHYLRYTAIYPIIHTTQSTILSIGYAFFVGIVSGIMLAQFIFVSPDILRPDNPSNSGNLVSFITYKPLLAFLGGFSARAVHKILNALIQAIETLISESTRDIL